MLNYKYRTYSIYLLYPWIFDNIILLYVSLIYFIFNNHVNDNYRCNNNLRNKFHR